MANRQDSIVDTGPSHPRVPRQQYGWLWSELPHIRGKNQSEGPRDGKKEKYEELEAKCPLAQNVRLTRSWHDTSLEEEGDSRYKSEERIDDACVDIAYNVEDYVIRPTYCHDREDEQEHVQNPEQHCHRFRKDTGRRVDG